MVEHSSVYIVAGTACQNRAERALPARDLYNSPLFNTHKEYLLNSDANWLILSDMHGLVWPDTMLAPYDPDLMADSEKTHRLERALHKDVVANTLIMSLGLQQPAGLAPREWRDNLLKTTTFILVGESETLSTAMTELALTGATVKQPYAGMSSAKQRQKIHAMHGGAALGSLCD
ncbi:TPA: DUF6884 domain-containing protein [Vibrio parahaemolyticus]|uniref:DUF6884 domain-containing protein n=1 Tax=Vibrio campbellii TaxID=680 RepID=UPI001F073517|nr:DUF6884 domain-containing protein [Vibrio campbellii]UMM06688.1 hypothetical protein MKR81_27455 [Vibrio campbellii]